MITLEFEDIAKITQEGEDIIISWQRPDSYYDYADSASIPAWLLKNVHITSPKEDLGKYESGA